MREVAGRVVSGGSAGAVGRVVAFRGFGGRRFGEAVLVGGNERVGSLLGGSADALLEDALPHAVRLFDVALGDGDAVAAGLACGGVATVLSSRIDAVPAPVWEALAHGYPVALATLVATTAGDGACVALVERPGSRLELVGSLGNAEIDHSAEEKARELLRLGRDAHEVAPIGEGTLVVEAYLPRTRLLVIGGGGLAQALVAQGGMLGWDVEVREESAGGLPATASSLGPSDAIVVLSHDHERSTPVLAAALGTACFVGALGSRHTQELRREHLETAGVDAESIARLHGPVGLDLGARTPEETALSIAAEILAWRGGRRARALSTGSGPING